MNEACVLIEFSITYSLEFIILQTFRTFCHFIFHETLSAVFFLLKKWLIDTRALRIPANEHFIESLCGSHIEFHQLNSNVLLRK